MPSKSSKSKANAKKESADPRRRQLRWTRVVVIIFGLLVVLSMILSMVAQQNLTK